MLEKAKRFGLASFLCLVVPLVACGDKDKGPVASAGDNDTGAVQIGVDSGGQGASSSDVADLDDKTALNDAASVSGSDASPGADVAVSGTYKWFKSCGAPVCKEGPWKSTQGVSLCVAQKEGGACSKLNDKCDAKHGCQVFLLCAKKDPKQQQGGCPISSRRYKTQIRYLTVNQEKKIATELLGMPMTTWLYRQGDDRRRLGFIIEDVPGSVAVDQARERVDLYSYISMAVATLKVQQRRIDHLERKLDGVTQSKRSAASAGQGKARK